MGERASLTSALAVVAAHAQGLVSSGKVVPDQPRIEFGTSLPAAAEQFLPVLTTAPINVVDGQIFSRAAAGAGASVMGEHGGPETPLPAPHAISGRFRIRRMVLAHAR